MPVLLAANHAVALVGWDDAYPRGNFRDPPPGDGAWLAKNSWVEDWGDGGSRNHIMFGDFAGWAYQYLAGIRLVETEDSASAVTIPTACAFAEFVVAPETISALTYVDASVDGPYGVIRSSWRRANGKLHFAVTVPPNTLAHLRLPGLAERTVGSGEWYFAVDEPSPGCR